MPAITIRDALATGRARLAVTPTTAQALLAHVTGRRREWLLAHDDRVLPAADAALFEGLLARAAAGEPLAYLTGEQEFCALAFRVTPDVLIPRPETELLVETALAWAEQSNKPDPSIVDVGTGSGVLAVTLAVRLPGASVTGVDISERALDVARANADRHAVSARVRWVQGDLLEDLPGLFDVILANLPYIPTQTLAGLEVSRWEPAPALDGGPDGLAVIRRLVAQAPSRLAEGGIVAFEIQYDQAVRVAALCRQALPKATIRLARDLAGLDRLVIAENSTPDARAVK